MLRSCVRSAAIDCINAADQGLPPGRAPDPKQQHYLNLCKMGAGPLYSFFFPYHLVHFEVPNAIARTVLFRDPVTKPLGGPVVEVCAVAKRNLKAGEVLDDYGMYMTYGEAANVEEMSACRYLPEGLVQGCMLTRDITKGPPVGWRTDCGRSSTTNSAVRLGCRMCWPPRRLADGHGWPRPAPWLDVEIPRPT